jgi:hypothetical protein
LTLPDKTPFYARVTSSDKTPFYARVTSSDKTPFYRFIVVVSGVLFYPAFYPWSRAEESAAMQTPSAPVWQTVCPPCQHPGAQPQVHVAAV